jgi:hypothetical protein
MEKSAPKFLCKVCDIECSTSWLFNRHLSTRKHQHRTFFEPKSTKKSAEGNLGTLDIHRTFSNPESAEKSASEDLLQNANEIELDKPIESHDLKNIEPYVEPKVSIKKQKHICNMCNKEYTAKSSLWYHKQKCQKSNSLVIIENQPTNESQDKFPIDMQNPSSVIIELLKQNQELQKQLIEISKEPKITNITNNNTNNHFNMNVFLNEDCKNALNIMDFVNSLNLTVTDLEETGKLGFVNGISRIFINALKNTEITMRPIHCTDIKRETVYVKDQDKWEKENVEKEKIKKAIDHISRKNLQMLPKWQAENPDFRYINTPENEKFMKISLSSLGAENEEDQAKLDKKILRNVLKEVIIEKQTTTIE